MSFYGSIYYQLIDAFYKVVLRNKGKNSVDFIDASKLPESFETQATGRKSVFGFDTGNKWINLNERTEVDQDANEAYSIYEIYHGIPDQSSENPNHGFKVLLDNNTLSSRTKEGVIQLDFHDEFETYETIYDDAGHIAKSEKKVYRLPKAEVNERIDNLEELVGLPDGYKDLPKMEKETDQHLYGYVNENSKDIKTLENYTGEWNNVVDFWSFGGDYAPTVAEVIGHIDSMYASPQDRITKHKTFAEIIGNTNKDNLPVLYEKMGKTDGSISLIGSILQESSRLDGVIEDVKNHKEASELSFSGIKALIGQSLDGEGSNVYSHIAADRAMIGDPIDNTNDIYDHISILYENMNWPVQTVDQQKITVSGEINRLDSKIGSLNAEATVASEISRLDNKVGSLENMPAETITSLRGYVDYYFDAIDSVFADDLGENYTIDKDGVQPNTAFGLIEENANNIFSIDQFIGRTITDEETPDENSLIAKISNLQDFVGGESLSGNEESLKTHIDNIKNYIGYSDPEEGKEITSITDQINNFGELIGAVSKDANDDSLITQIESIKNDIGILTNVTNAHEFGENVTTDNITDILNNILTRLETLEDDVKNLKTETPPTEPNSIIPDKPENGDFENGEEGT